MCAQRVSRHNGRSGKSGAYSSKHNDRQFDADKADHIDATRTQLNVYWDYQNGQRTHEEQQNGNYPPFQSVEKQFYADRYAAFTAGQHERNRKAGHSCRDRSTDDLLADRRTCPEETIYQIGKEGSETPPDVLLEVLSDFHDRFNERFGEHVHIIDWSLHLDETTPHVHERHVFDVVNKYGEIEPRQEKALEAMGISRPKPNEKSGQYNNRKMTFDAICRDMFIDVCKQHDLSIEEEPIYGGQAYREKNDYIIESQRAEIAEQQQVLSNQLAQQAQNSQLLTQQQVQLERNADLLEDEEKFIASIAAQAHDEAVRLTAENVIREVQNDTANALSVFKEKNTSPERKLKPAIREAVIAYLDGAISLIRNRTEKLIDRIRKKLFSPEIRTENTKKLERKLAPSIHEQLRAFRQKQLEMPPRQRKIHRDDPSR